ncbi:MAG TPA: HAD family hydrolase [Thermoleophilaceae bacterium]
MLPEAILFDIDGTLINSGGAGARSWAFAFERLYGHPVDIGAFTDAGMTDPEVGRLTFAKDQGHEPSPRELARLIHTYLSVLPDFVSESEGYRVLPGVQDLLPRLMDEGVFLGITTGAVEAAAHVKLGRGRLNHFFSFGGYGSDSADRIELTERAFHRGRNVAGHELDPKRTMVVGDTPLDVKAAQGAGLIAIGVASHHNTKEELAAAGADYVLGSLEEPLPEL